VYYHHFTSVNYALFNENHQMRSNKNKRATPTDTDGENHSEC